MTTSTQSTVELLTEARVAYHDLITGKAARVVVDANGEKVEFVAANRQGLYLYIQQLESRVADAAAAHVSRAPAGFIF